MAEDRVVTAKKNSAPARKSSATSAYSSSRIFSDVAAGKMSELAHATAAGIERAERKAQDLCKGPRTCASAIVGALASTAVGTLLLLVLAMSYGIVMLAYTGIYARAWGAGPCVLRDLPLLLPRA